MTFDEAYSTNPEQIRRDRDRYIAKARRERAIATEYFAAGTRRDCNHDRYDRCLSAASYHYDRQDNYVLAARRLNWRLLFSLRNRSLPL